MKNKIAIIGSGISGLSSAYFALKKFPKHKVVLYGSREGGAINCYRDSFNNL
jgi:protoporphyrinogen oxidase